MSVYYTVKERISIKNSKNEYIAFGIIDTIASIGKQMMCDRAEIRQLSLSADGKAYSFAGHEVTHDLHEILRAISNATALELTLEYDSVNCDFPLAECVEEAFEANPALADEVFYSLYNKADCEPGVGVLVAYGKKNGTIYNGAIVPKACATTPAGNWESADSVVAFEDDITAKTDVDGIKKCAADLTAIGADVQLEVTEKEVSLFVNGITLDSVEKTETFIKTCCALYQATDGDCSFMAEFVDPSADEARVMVIDFDENGEHTVKLAQIL